MIEINELLNEEIVKKYVFDGVALPAVSSSDNGKVLTVVNGEWVATTPSGGGGSNVMVVTITVDRTTDPFTVSFDKTPAQINAHLTADDNNIVKFKYAIDADVYYYDVSYVWEYDDTLVIMLFCIQAGTNGCAMLPGCVLLSSSSITWDATLDGTTNNLYPGAGYDINYDND